MKYTGLIKLLLVVFIVIAIVNYRGDTLDKLAIKTGMFLRGFTVNPTKSENNTSDKKILKEEKKEVKTGPVPKVSSADGSVVGTFIANIINKVLETPNGQILLKESLNRATTRENFNQGNEIAERRYLFVDSVIGDKRSVKCGDEVEIKYKIYKKSDHDIKDKKSLKTKVVIGSNSLAKPLENALIGMKEGGSRRVFYFVEDNLKTNDKNKYNQLISEVQLEKIHSSNIDEKDKIRVFVHNPSKIGKRILCGDKVNFVYKVSDLNNELISDKDSPNRIVLDVYKDPRNPLREIYNSIVDTYLDHVRVTAIMKYKQAKELIKGLGNDHKINKKNEDFVVVDLYGAPTASIAEIQNEAMINSFIGVKK